MPQESPNDLSELSRLLRAAGALIGRIDPTGRGRLGIADDLRAAADKLAPPQADPRRYFAIPLLVYVSQGAYRDAESAEGALVDHVRDLAAATHVFVAEDYLTGEAIETEEDDLSAMIGTACESV